MLKLSKNKGKGRLEGERSCERPGKEPLVKKSASAGVGVK